MCQVRYECCMPACALMCLVFCFTLTIWELVLNFDNEFRLIWRSHQKRVLVTKLLYGFLRYSMLFLATLNLVGMITPYVLPYDSDLLLTVVCNITPQRGDIVSSLCDI